MDALASALSPSVYSPVFPDHCSIGSGMAGGSPGCFRCGPEDFRLPTPGWLEDEDDGKEGKYHGWGGSDDDDDDDDDVEDNHENGEGKEKGDEKPLLDGFSGEYRPRTNHGSSSSDASPDEQPLYLRRRGPGPLRINVARANGKLPPYGRRHPPVRPVAEAAAAVAAASSLPVRMSLFTCGTPSSSLARWLVGLPVDLAYLDSYTERAGEEEVHRGDRAEKRLWLGLGLGLERESLASVVGRELRREGGDDDDDDDEGEEEAEEDERDGLAASRYLLSEKESEVEEGRSRVSVGSVRSRIGIVVEVDGGVPEGEVAVLEG